MPRKSRSYIASAMISCVVALGCADAVAEPLPSPQGLVILTVSGHIDDTNAGNTAQFDLEMLEELARVNFETTTIWTDGPQSFTGVPLSALLTDLGVQSGRIKAAALNDYSVEIPFDEIAPDAPVIAYLRGGEPMPRRNKGPLWMLYPYDSDADYRSEITLSRSVWQLDRIEILK